MQILFVRHVFSFMFHLSLADYSEPISTTNITRADDPHPQTHVCAISWLLVGPECHLCHISVATLPVLPGAALFVILNGHEPVLLWCVARHDGNDGLLKPTCAQIKQHIEEQRFVLEWRHFCLNPMSWNACSQHFTTWNMNENTWLTNKFCMIFNCS